MLDQNRPNPPATTQKTLPAAPDWRKATRALLIWGFPTGPTLQLVWKKPSLNLTVIARQSVFSKEFLGAKKSHAVAESVLIIIHSCSKFLPTLRVNGRRENDS